MKLLREKLLGSFAYLCNKTGNLPPLCSLSVLAKSRPSLILDVNPGNLLPLIMHTINLFNPALFFLATQ